MAIFPRIPQTYIREMEIITFFSLEINIIVDVFMGGDVFIIKYIYLLRVTKKVIYLIIYSNSSSHSNYLNNT